METDYSTKLADNIFKTSLWDTFVGNVVRLQSMPEKYPDWRFQVLDGLALSHKTNYIEMLDAINSKQNRTAKIAWCARNLAELTIRIIDCTANEDSARKLYEDAARDGRDLLDRLGKWAQTDDGDKELLDTLPDAHERLKTNAASVGIDDISGAYQEISQIAKRLGHSNNFSIMYKILSKYAHPTAWTIIQVLDRRSEIEVNNLLFEMGSTNFIEGFRRLNEHVLSIVNGDGTSRDVDIETVENVETDDEKK